MNDEFNNVTPNIEPDVNCGENSNSADNSVSEAEPTQPQQQNSYAQQGYQQPQQNPYAQQGYQQPQQNPYAQQGYQQPTYTTGYYQYNPAMSVQTAENDGFAIASLILGIVGMITCCTFLPSLLGLIFGIVSKAKNDGTRPSGVSTAGIVLSVIGLIAGVFCYILMI